jgi:hypothetical protein
VVSFTPLQLFAGKKPPVPIGEEAGWTSKPIWTLLIIEEFYSILIIFRITFFLKLIMK